MTNTYHDLLDQWEARVRAEQEEIELAKAEKLAKELKFASWLLGRIEEQTEGSDTSMMSQLNDAGFGSGGVS